MENKDRRLLLIDLCARLPYGVKVSITAHNLDYEEDFGKTIIAELTGIFTAKDDDGIAHTCFMTCYDKYKTQGNDIETIKPYLRPMSSMTEEESKEYRMFIDYSYNDFTSESTPCVYVDKIENYINWLNEHHFDYRGLIKKGLALEAPEGMYKF